jgi:hypothetical protein
VETRKILLAVVLGLILFDLYYLVRDEPAPAAKPSHPTFAVGKVTDVSITLVSTDAKALACAGSGTIAGRHCEFDAKKERFSQPIEAGVEGPMGILAPYKTVDDVLLLVPALFDDPKLKERLSVDPPDFGREHSRFVAHCKFHPEGRMKKFDVRWAPNGQWYPPGEDQTWVGTVSGCEISEP